MLQNVEKFPTKLGLKPDHVHIQKNISHLKSKFLGPSLDEHPGRRRWHSSLFGRVAPTLVVLRPLIFV